MKFLCVAMPRVVEQCPWVEVIEAKDSDDAMVGFTAVLTNKHVRADQVDEIRIEPYGTVH